MRRLLSALLLAGLALALAPAASPAATRTINFDDFTAPMAFADAEPLTERYASLGVHFAGPAAGSGGAVLDVSARPRRDRRERAERAGVRRQPRATQAAGLPTDPETITFDHADPLRLDPGRAEHRRHRDADGIRRHDRRCLRHSGCRPRRSQTLDVAAARITSLRLEYTGTATVWDDLTWGTAPVSGNDAFTTPANTALTVGAAGVLGNDSDADGDALTAALSRAPNNGPSSCGPTAASPTCPRPGFSGVDTFDYRANDGTGNGNDATVTIAVQPPPPLGRRA